MPTKIKICGITDPKTAYFAAQKGADYIGIVCAKRSKRYVKPDHIKSIATAAKDGGAQVILVFESENVENILELCQLHHIDMVQLHGEISQTINGILPLNLKTIIAIPVSQNGDLVETSIRSDYLLFDSVIAGSGQCFSWQRLLGHKLLEDQLFFLAGGLNSMNVRSAIDCLNPYAVDISSGVERKPGVKDNILIEHFIDMVRGNSNDND